MCLGMCACICVCACVIACACVPPPGDSCPTGAGAPASHWPRSPPPPTPSPYPCYRRWLGPAEARAGPRAPAFPARAPALSLPPLLRAAAAAAARPPSSGSGRAGASPGARSPAALALVTPAPGHSGEPGEGARGGTGGGGVARQPPRLPSRSFAPLSCSLARSRSGGSRGRAQMRVRLAGGGGGGGKEAACMRPTGKSRSPEGACLPRGGVRRPGWASWLLARLP